MIDLHESHQSVSAGALNKKIFKILQITHAHFFAC